MKVKLEKIVYSKTYIPGNFNLMNAHNIYDTDIKFIKGVGERRAQLFAKIDVHDFYDVLHFYPRSYIDFSKISLITECEPGETCCIEAEVLTDVKEHVVRKNMTLYKLDVADDSAVLHVTIFNNSYLADTLERGEIYYFLGKVNREGNRYEMSPQMIEKKRDDLFYIPVYNLTAGLSSKIVGNVVKNAIAKYRENNFQDPIPDNIRKYFGLCHEQFALSAIHFPVNENDISIARKRFIFEELFLLQCGMLSLRKKSRVTTRCIIEKDYSEEFEKFLPFELTGAQKRVISECITDMKSGIPMNRLVQGDVGSGKTVVAGSQMYSMVKNGFQCALMAPTELLAKQHAETLFKILPDDINVALLTGSLTASKKKKLKEKVMNGEVDVLVGTHAILTQDVEFKNLGLVVTDEQHRFGVSQRGILSGKGDAVNVLVMSATPIPRTLSLIIYGELDISIIDELPKGRQEISTYSVDSRYEKRIYDFIKKHLDMGLQAYIVCPLVEENDESELTAAKELSEKLSNEVFAAYNVGLLHGKMKAKEKNEVMEKFASGEIQLLVSTTVIEVGIDVPNSVIMYIKDADRFGLSQLHQLRGRVGRGKEKSYCILMSDSSSVNTKKRLEIMCGTNNGFVIADEDLKLRGPGDFFGAKQSGLPRMKIADFADDLQVVKDAAKAARSVFKNDPGLDKPENEALKDAIKRLFNTKETIVFN